LFVSVGFFPDEIGARLGSHGHSRHSSVSFSPVWDCTGRCSRPADLGPSTVCGPEALVLFGGTRYLRLYITVDRIGPSRLWGEFETGHIGRAIFRAISSISN